jgi:large subunit ribosomal protein L15
MKTLVRLKTNKKRLGRGYGSGKGGHTSGRGQKGQKARGSVGILFEGMKMKKSFVKRLPFVRGKLKSHPTGKMLVLNLKDLKDFPNDLKTVNIQNLVKAGLVDKVKAVKYGVKILGSGEISQKLRFELPVSEPAALKIKKAGGEINN